MNFQILAGYLPGENWNLSLFACLEYKYDRISTNFEVGMGYVRTAIRSYLPSMSSNEPVILFVNKLNRIRTNFDNIKIDQQIQIYYP